LKVMQLDGFCWRNIFNFIRWGHKYVVLDCPTEMAKEIVVSHVRDVTLGKRTYHYLLSGLVSWAFSVNKTDH
jgi:hypothetical protein